MKNFVLISLCLIVFQAHAQQGADTTKKKNIADTIKKDLLTAPDTVQHLHSQLWTLGPPGVLILYGVSSFYIHPIRQEDYIINNDVMKDHPNFDHHPENFLQYSPVIAVYGLNLVGVHGKNTFVDRTLIYGMAEGMMALTVFSVKKLTHRLRPNGSNSYSFPSGHTANAFVGAEFMAQEYSEKSVIYGAVGYTLASVTGIYRVYNRDHWFSDIIAGAGVGILATKGAYLLYPYIRNSLFSKKADDNPLKKQRKSSSIVMPSYQDGAVGLQFAMQF